MSLPNNHYPRPVNGIRPNPRGGYICSAVQWRKCPSYLGCHGVGVRWGWPALDCAECPIYRGRPAELDGPGGRARS